MHVNNLFLMTGFFITKLPKQSIFYCKKFPGCTRWNLITWCECKQLPVGDYVEVVYEVVPEDAREFL